jgi:hypothetical protein
LPLEQIIGAFVGALSTLLAGLAVAVWRRRYRHEDKTSEHGERISSLEAQVRSLERITERGLDAILYRLEQLPCNHGGHCSRGNSAERRVG